MTDNIYNTPEAELVDEQNNDNMLASRGRRFSASMIDGFTIMVITIPTMYFTGGFEGIAEGQQNSLEYNLLIGILGIIIFVVLNINILRKYGQTIGKKILGIKIVDLNGKLPNIKNHFLKRYATYFIPGQIPIAGQLFSVINILFIFGKQKRCLHDYIAGTKVVKK
jgi:uncharacterized RDD family membrane protein YckC